MQAAVGLIETACSSCCRAAGRASTKFISGHVLVVGGSRGLTGAPGWPRSASMRAGAGYVTACVPASLQAILAGAAPPEVMTRALPDDATGRSTAEG